jgi:hypothetical protein
LIPVALGLHCNPRASSTEQACIRSGKLARNPSIPFSPVYYHIHRVGVDNE